MDIFELLGIGLALLVVTGFTVLEIEEPVIAGFLTGRESVLDNETIVVSGDGSSFWRFGTCTWPETNDT